MIGAGTRCDRYPCSPRDERREVTQLGRISDQACLEAAVGFRMQEVIRPVFQLLPIGMRFRCGELQDAGVRIVMIEFERARRSEEHTSELQSLMRISYAVFCSKKKNNTKQIT